MEIAQLEAFIAAAEEGSFTAAAEVLGLTQPSVSARIAALENRLKGPLFERRGRGLVLTHMGRAFMPYAERILNTMHDGLEAMERYAAGKSGMVTIASLDMPAMYMLPDPISRFRQAYPDVDFGLILRVTPQIVDMVHAGTMSLGLLGTRFSSNRLQIEGQFVEPIRAFAAPSHTLAQRQQSGDHLKLADLYEHTIYRVTLNREVTAIVDQIVAQARQGSGGAVLIMPALMVIGPLIRGEAVAFLPESAVRLHTADGRLVGLTIHDLPPLSNELMLVSLRGRELDPMTQAFVQFIRRQWRHIRVD